MALEVEAKFPSDPALSLDMPRRLAEAGGRFVRRVLEVNHIFDSPGRDLLSRGCGLRVREYRRVEGPPPSPTLTYKGPRQAGPLKTREEIETGLEDPAATVAILAALGFAEAVSFEKRRESWSLGDCAVELDEVPCLGHFIEIEGPDDRAVLRARDLLGLAGVPVEPKSYVALLAEWCRRHGLPPVGIAFR